MTTLGTKKVRPVSAAVTAERIASDERLRKIIARAKEAGERARAASQRARELREAANTRKVVGERFTATGSDQDDDPGSSQQQQLKRRRPTVSITSPTNDVLKPSYRQATPR